MWKLYVEVLKKNQTYIGEMIFYDPTKFEDPTQLHLGYMKLTSGRNE